MKIKLLSLLTETTSCETKIRRNSLAIHTSLAFINDQGFPPRDLFEDRSKVARVCDRLVGGDENVVLEFCIPRFRLVMRQLVPPDNLATFCFAVVGDHP